VNFKDCIIFILENADKIGIFMMISVIDTIWLIVDFKTREDKDISIRDILLNDDFKSQQRYNGV